MKKKVYLLAITMLLSLAALNSKASVIISNTDVGFTKDAIAKMTPDERKEHLAEVKARIREIKKIDKSQMSDEDRKQLREELRSLRHQSSDLGGDIVIGTGAAVVVVLVLLLSGA